jgi:hypothetical protein
MRRLRKVRALHDSGARQGRRTTGQERRKRLGRPPLSVDVEPHVPADAALFDGAQEALASGASDGGAWFMRRGSGMREPCCGQLFSLRAAVAVTLLAGCPTGATVAILFLPRWALTRSSPRPMRAAPGPRMGMLSLSRRY